VNKRLLVIIIGIVLVAGAGIAFASGVFGGSGSGAMAEHLSVAEANALPPGQEARVGGDVQPGSVSWDNSTGSLVFTLTGDDHQDLRVSYPDVAPNDFKPGSKVLVEGTTSAAGAFQATSLQTTTSPLCRACHG